MLFLPPFPSFSEAQKGPFQSCQLIGFWEGGLVGHFGGKVTCWISSALYEGTGF